MKTLQAPLIHLNGSNIAQLCADLQTASNAIHKAIEAMYECSPNQRDYYPLKEGAWKLACMQHTARIVALKNVWGELYLINEAILDGKTEIEVEDENA